MTARILFFSNSVRFYGAPRSLALLLRGLDRERFRPRVFCPYGGPLVERLEEIGVPVVLGLPDRDPRVFRSLSPGARVLRGGPAYLRRLHRLLVEERPDLLYLNTIGSATPALMGLLHRIPVVVHVRESRSYLAGPVNRLRRLPLLHGPVRLVAVSRAVQEQLVAAGADPARIRVVPNGVDPGEVRFDEEDRARLRHELDLDPAEIAIGLVGAIEPRKGTLDLVEAARRLAGQRDDLCFLLVGGVKDAAYGEAVAARIRELGLEKRFRLTGYRADADRFYSALDIVANPTREEPFARVNLEAMAAARPVVATDVDGNPEALVAEETGLLVPPADPPALARALGRLCRDPGLRERLGTAGRRRVEEKFTARACLEGVQEVLAEALPRGRRAAGETGRPTAVGVYTRGGAAHILWKILDVGLGFGSVWLLTRLLAPGAYGDLLLALTLVTLVELVAAGGFERIVLFRVSRLDPDRARDEAPPLVGAVLSLGLVPALLLALVLTLTARPLASLFACPALALWLPLLAWRLPLSLARGVQAAWHQASQRVATAILLGQLLPTGVTVILLAFVLAAGLGPAWIAAALLGGMAAAAFSFYRLRPLPLFRGRGGLTLADGIYGLKLMLTGVVNRAVRMTDMLMLGLLATSEMRGRFGVAARVALLTAFAHQALTSVLTPRLGGYLARGDRQGLEREYSRVRRVALAATLVTAALLAGLGPVILRLFGDYGSAYPVLLLLAGAYLVPAAFGANGALLNMGGFGGWSFALAVLLLAANVGFNALMIPRWGIAGAAGATLLALSGANILNSVMVWRLQRLPTLSAEVILCTAAALAVLAAGAAGLVPPAATGLLLLLPAGLTALGGVGTRPGWTPPVLDRARGWQP